MIDKTSYHSIEIPDCLDAAVQHAIEEGLSKRRGAGVVRWLKRAGATAALFALCVISALNLSPSFASAACGLPVVGDLCQVFLFREYHTADPVKRIDAQIPQIENTGKTDLEVRVNQEIQRVVHQCLAQSEARANDYYEAFLATGGNPEEFIPVDITISYETKYMGQNYISFIVSQYETRFDAYNCKFYYNIDLDSGENITLKDWFGPQYRQIIAQSIQNTIDGWSEEQRSILWEDLSIADLISEDTDFYFNQDGQVVVVIGKYEAAYGAAGELEFTIEASAP